MRFFLVTAYLSIVSSGLIAVEAASQTVGGSASMQDTTVVDSATIARLRDEINWRRIIRLRTNGDWFELGAPKVELAGIGYESLTPIDSTDHAGLPAPIPMRMVREIRVRKGNVRGGLVTGAIVGSGLGLLWIFRAAGGGDIDVYEVPLALVGGAVLGALPGLVIGSVTGELLYTWQPVYTAPEPPAEAPAAAFGLTLRFQLSS